jgi:hypothetical protein
MDVLIHQKVNNVGVMNFSAGKIKALIDDYVWREIRRPKIEEKYSPANLIIELEINGGDIEMLDSW